MCHHLWDVIGGVIGIRVSEDHERACRFVGDQCDGGAENDGTGPFGADQGVRDVEPMFGQQRIEVVPRHAAWNIDELAAHFVGVGVAECAQRIMDLATAAAGRDDFIELLVTGGADGKSLAIVGEDVEVDHLVTRQWTGAVELRHHRVYTT